MSPTPKNNKQTLLQYAGLSTQLLVLIGVAVFAGIKCDAWLHFSTPFATWLLPLLAILVVMIKIVKDTSKNNKLK
jgi:hypothetical protein